MVLAGIGNINVSDANVPAVDHQEHSESYPMVGGDGENSYARISSLQREMAQRCTELLVPMIAKNLDLKTDNHGSTNNSVTFRVADLGCSIGPNTFHSMKIIIEAIHDKYKKVDQKQKTRRAVVDPVPEPEFLAFFNDHVTNDFNHLFNSLPADRRFFATGIPGSFHGRLLPRNSLDVVYSSGSLQWLSRTPKELSDPNSPAYNGDRIFYLNAPDPVCDAYSGQFDEDMDSFLSARIQELVPGGLMLLIMPGRANGKAPSHCSSVGRMFMPLETILLDMAKEGLVSEKQIASFNIPMYLPSPEELKINVQRNPRVEILELKSIISNRNRCPLPSRGELRAGFEGLLLKYFGIEIVDELFDRYKKNIPTFNLHNPDEYAGVAIFVALRRKF